MQFKYREVDINKDLAELLEIWIQAGWREEKFNMEELLKWYFPDSTSCIAEENGAIAGVIGTMPGSFRHLNNDINLCAVISLNTAIQYRRRGVGGTLLLRALHEAKQEGAEVSVLGAFDLGYYNKVGFGNGCSIPTIAFDPADIRSENREILLHKLTTGDIDQMQKARLCRYKAHGACSIAPTGFTASIAHATAESAIGLGMYHHDTLVAHLWGVVKNDIEVSIEWWAADSPWYWIELFKGISVLQDQVQRITMPRPAKICVEDLLRSPCRRTRSMMPGDAEMGPATIPEYWQIRVLDVAQCIRKTSLPVDTPLRVNARIYGEDVVPKAQDNNSISDYTIVLGEHSECERGHQKGLPLLECSIGAFSRMWCGALPPSTLVHTDHFKVSGENLLTQLDRYMRMPTPLCDWYF